MFHCWRSRDLVKIGHLGHKHLKFIVNMWQWHKIDWCQTMSVDEMRWFRGWTERVTEKYSKKTRHTRKPISIFGYRFLATINNKNGKHSMMMMINLESSVHSFDEIKKLMWKHYQNCRLWCKQMLNKHWQRERWYRLVRGVRCRRGGRLADRFHCKDIYSVWTQWIMQ